MTRRSITTSLQLNENNLSSYMSKRRTTTIANIYDELIMKCFIEKAKNISILC